MDILLPPEGSQQQRASLLLVRDGTGHLSQGLSASAAQRGALEATVGGFPAVPNSHTSWGTKGLLAWKSSVKLK